MLKFTVDSLDSVPEGLRDQYVEADGKYRLNVEGYEDPAGLKSALQKERDAAKTYEKQVKAWAGLGKTPEEIQELLQKQQELEDKELIDKKEFDKLFSKRTERLRSDYDKKLAEATEAAEAAIQRAQAFRGRVLDDAIRAAAAEAGLHPYAIDDALFRARELFDLDDSGQAVRLGEDGSPVLGKDGKTPFTPTEWLEGMKDKAPHWFPATASGGGAGGNSGRGTTKAKWDGTEQERMAAIRAKFPNLETS